MKSQGKKANEQHFSLVRLLSQESEYIASLFG